VKKNVRLLLSVVTFVAALGWIGTSFGPRPFFFKEKTLVPSNGGDGSPEQTALNYLRDSITAAGGDASELKPARMRVSVSSQSARRTVVNILEAAEDDSLYLFYHRFTLERERSVWRVIRHQVAWQGRGRLGWTTRPTS
jgi:hypothetical protein